MNKYTKKQLLLLFFMR